MSQKFTLQIRESILTIRELTFERSFMTEEGAKIYLQSIVNEGIIPDDVEEDAYSEICDESEIYPAAINGNDHLPGLCAGIVDEKMGYEESAFTDTRGQKAFTWMLDGELRTWPLGYGEGAISGNVLIAQPCEGKPTDNETIEAYGLVGAKFARPLGGGAFQMWEILFVFKEPRQD